MPTPDCKCSRKIHARTTIIAAPTNAVFTGEGLDTIVFPNLGRWHMSRFRSSYRGVGAFYPSAARIAGEHSD